MATGARAGQSTDRARPPGPVLAGLSSPLTTAALLAASLALGAPACGDDDADERERAARAQCEESSSDLFERRIAPLLNTDRPQSCNGCHLSGVDLSMFVRDSACESVACLVELGLADPENPEQSLILEWIRRARPESDLITEQVITEEYEGFREWLVESLACGDGACRRAPCGSARFDTFCRHDDELPPESSTPAPCSDAELDLLFRDAVFSHRDRCYPCHHEGQNALPPEVPRFFATTGNCNTASLQTSRTMLQAGYFDLDEPERSLILLKPLTESAGGLEHGGDDKFQTTDDATYLEILSYIERLSACRSE